MEWGGQLSTLLEMQEAGMTPQALEDRPKLEQRFVRLYRDFLLLHSARTAGQTGPNPLPLSELQAFLAMFPIACVDYRESWVRVMKSVDAVVVTKLYERLQPPQK